MEALPIGQKVRRAVVFLISSILSSLFLSTKENALSLTSFIGFGVSGVSGSSPTILKEQDSSSMIWAAVIFNIYLLGISCFFLYYVLYFVLIKVKFFGPSTYENRPNRQYE